MKSKIIFGVFIILILILAAPSYGAENYSNEVLNSKKGKAGRIGLSLGTNNMLGLSLYWSQLDNNNWSPHGSIYSGSIYYRKGDFPDDHIIASDIAYKVYNSQIAYNEFNVYRGVGLGYASVQNPSLSSFLNNHEKYNYFYISGYLGAIYWVNTSWGKVLDYFVELQPIIGRDGIVLLLKLGVGM